MDFLEHLDKPVERPPHPAALPDDELMRDVDLVRGRTSGPGGQHRNKVETGVTLTHRPTGISAKAGERRQAGVNQRVALRRLRLALAVGHRLPVPAGDVRSELWRSRTRKRRIVCSTKHADYPAMLAEALDLLDDAGWEPARAAVRLEVSTSQLIKLVGGHPAALVMVNERRREGGLHALK